MHSVLILQRLIWIKNSFHLALYNIFVLNIIFAEPASTHIRQSTNTTQSLHASNRFRYIRREFSFKSPAPRGHFEFICSISTTPPCKSHIAGQILFALCKCELGFWENNVKCLLCVDFFVCVWECVSVWGDDLHIFA